jgi:hypothetical protein
MHQTMQERACGDDEGAPFESDADCSFHVSYPGSVATEPTHLSLLDIQSFLALAYPFHPNLIGALVALRPGRLDGWSLAGVKHPEVDSGQICAPAHLAAERINFTYQVALCEPTDGWIAGHLTDCVEI